jgi:ATP adenylyltransferase
MENLFAPWRMEYILSGAETSSACIFCDKPAREPSHHKEDLLLLVRPLVQVMMNKFPYNNGHVMVIPRRHVADPADLPPDEHDALFRTTTQTSSLIRQALSAHGLNVGMNLGRVAGAGIDQHCHVHVVPRWNGDTNFMPVLSQTKVISEHLAATYDRLKPLFDKLP